MLRPKSRDSETANRNHSKTETISTRNTILLSICAMGSSESPLRIFFFPFMAHGHMIPMVDMVRLFASKGVHCTIITTPGNENVITKSLGKVQSLGLDISIKTIPFPSVEGLPEGCENLDMVYSPALYFQFFNCSQLIREPFEQLLEDEDYKPDCLIADMFFPWSTDSAAKYGIPRLVFQGSSYFVNCAEASVRTHKPYESVSSDTEPFVLPGLPDNIILTRSQLMMHHLIKNNVLSQLLDGSAESEVTSYGVIVNSFYELEPAYADYYKNFLGRRAWHVGPLSLSKRDVEEKAARGKQASIDENECLKWLDSKNPDSVVYVCFGSNCKFSDEQLGEIALGLEGSGQEFIWVIRRMSDSKMGSYLPEGFEDRVKERAMLIRGWAPQVLILDHPAVGGFVSHCGWNSTLEGISAGLPMVTWPGFAEQFYNEKLITDVLKIGVSVGARVWAHSTDDLVRKEAIQKAVREAIEGQERRNKARQLGKMARNAVEKDGSSDTSLNSLLLELRPKKAPLTSHYQVI